ncbi:MAG: leucine-rich repeat domain-containing protein [Holosporales bacterium]|jgi:hypothetical protein|nr:leucine-rich repeat domain-containing protein [Holosporales bacterium]
MRNAALTRVNISLIIIEKINAFPESLLKDARFDCLMVFGDYINAVGDDCFFACKSHDVTRFINESPITHVGRSAFRHAKVQNFTGNPGLLQIGSLAFFATEITEVDLSRSLNVTIGSGAFTFCKKLSHIVLPPNLVSIPEDLFFDCNSLKSIFIPDSVISFQIRCFMKSGLLDIILPLNLLSIHDHALAQTHIQALIIPPNIVIEPYTFLKCRRLSYIVLPSNMVTIPEGLFAYCESLTSISIPDSVTSFQKRCFSESGLRYISLPPRLVSIHEGALAGTEIQALTIPSSVLSIKAEVFYACRQLSSIVFPPNMVLIPECLFVSCESLTSISIPNSVISLQRGCFCNSGLRYISLPPKLLSIHNDALALTDIQVLNIPQSVLSIGPYAMHGISFVTFKRSAKTRYFHNMFTRDESCPYKLPCVREVHNAFFVTEVPVCELVTEEQFSEFSNENNLDSTRNFNSSALFCWYLNNFKFYPVINKKAGCLQLRPEEITEVYVCVPGENDQDLFGHLKHGLIYIRPEGAKPVSQIIEEQNQDAQSRLGDALRRRSIAIETESREE